MISLLLPLVLCFLVVSESSAPTTSPSCQRTCGNISIPYPFGMGHPTCFRDKWFEIKCNESSTTPKAFLMGQNDLELLNISLQGHLSLRSWMSQRCYNQDGNVTFYQTASISFAHIGSQTPATSSQPLAVTCNHMWWVSWALVSSEVGACPTAARIIRP